VHKTALISFAVILERLRLHIPAPQAVFFSGCSVLRFEECYKFVREASASFVRYEYNETYLMQNPECLGGLVLNTKEAFYWALFPQHSFLYVLFNSMLLSKGFFLSPGAVLISSFHTQAPFSAALDFESSG
jgi:hypothetical protein